MIDRRPALIAAAEERGRRHKLGKLRPRERPARGGARRRPQRRRHRHGRRRPADRPLPDEGIKVDPERRTVRVEPGVTIGELDRKTQAFGLAAPMGVVSETGIAGLTLGGGLGWLRRKHGLSSDNLVSVDVVTADGSFLRASEDENPDLFWGSAAAGATSAS